MPYFDIGYIIRSFIGLGIKNIEVCVSGGYICLVSQDRKIPCSTCRNTKWLLRTLKLYRMASRDNLYS